MIVFGNEDHGQAICEAAGATYNPVVDVCISRVTSESKLLGGMVFTAYTKASIGVHVSGFSPSWINSDLLWVGFHYPFVRLGCSKVLSQVPASNSKALEFNRKIGFSEEARIKDVFPDGDLIVFGMKRDACRWLKIKPRSLKEPD